jgi:hypothetical protein
MEGTKPPPSCQDRRMQKLNYVVAPSHFLVQPAESGREPPKALHAIDEAG